MFRLRVTLAYGDEASSRIWNSEVTIIGCGGTGSALAHSLARSGVGVINLIDFDFIEDHNSERVHGCFTKHLCSNDKVLKVHVLRDLINSINPDIKVRCFTGSILDIVAISLAVQSDIVLGCTDTEHSKAALTEIVKRYLVLGFNINVALETQDNRINGQLIQLSYLNPIGPCLYCMDLIDGVRMSFELMSEAEKNRRVEDEEKNQLSGETEGTYWKEKPLIPTVGYLATIGGELLAGYSLGLITGTSEPPHNFIELNLTQVELGLVPINHKAKVKCICCQMKGI